MSEEIGKEFEQEDVELVRGLQSQYATNTAQIGQVEVERPNRISGKLIQQLR
jgi:hypothetical protein